MRSVNADPAVVERQFDDGELVCQADGGVLARWGWARERRVATTAGAWEALRPRRARCRVCGTTHVLVPPWCLARRADRVEVIGQALEAKALGRGQEKIAAELGRPCGRVRGWIAALGESAERWRVLFTSILVEVSAEAGIDAALPRPAGTALADAVSVMTAAARAVALARPGMCALPRWQVIAAITSSLLIFPGGPEIVATRDRVWEVIL